MEEEFRKKERKFRSFKMKKLSRKTRRRSVKRFCIICAKKNLIHSSSASFIHDFEIKTNIKLILVITIINSSCY
jgi:hypothetical protein